MMMMMMMMMPGTNTYGTNTYRYSFRRYSVRTPWCWWCWWWWQWRRCSFECWWTKAFQLLLASQAFLGALPSKGCANAGSLQKDVNRIENSNNIPKPLIKMLTNNSVCVCVQTLENVQNHIQGISLPANIFSSSCWFSPYSSENNNIGDTQRYSTLKDEYKHRTPRSPNINA